MAEHSLSYRLSAIQAAKHPKDAINEYLAKTQSLVTVAISTEFSQQPSEIIYHYLWVIDEILGLLRVSYERLEQELSQGGTQERSDE